MDITYAKTDEGFPYLAFVLGVYSRRIAGWSTGSHLGTGLVVDTPEMTAWRRKPAAASFITPTAVLGIRRSPLASGSKRWASSLR